MAPVRSCPNCGRDGRFLEISSYGASVSYYRCEPCNHVWYYFNDDRFGTPHDVTIPAPDREILFSVPSTFL